MGGGGIGLSRNTPTSKKNPRRIPPRHGCQYGEPSISNENRNLYREAEMLFIQAISIRRAIDDPMSEDLAIDLEHFGGMKKSIGDYATAADLFNEALNIYIFTNDPINIARAQNNVAMACFESGNTVRADSLWAAFPRVSHSAIRTRRPASSDGSGRTRASSPDVRDYAGSEYLLRVHRLSGNRHRPKRDQMTSRSSSKSQPEPYNVRTCDGGQFTFPMRPGLGRSGSMNTISESATA